MSRIYKYLKQHPRARVLSDVLLVLVLIKGFMAGNEAIVFLLVCVMWFIGELLVMAGDELIDAQKDYIKTLENSRK